MNIENLKKKKIAILGPISWRTPPEHYGAWESVVSNLTEGLVKRGFDITLFSSGNSKTCAKLEWISKTAYSEDSNLDPKVWECMHISYAIERFREFDLIHSHYDFLPLTYTCLLPENFPFLTTIHGFSDKKILPVYHKYNKREKNYFVSISDTDRDPEVDYISTVYNGIDLSEFEYDDIGGDDLIFLGRIHNDKGTHLAIEVAKRVKKRLIIAGIIQDQKYFDELIKPHINDDDIKFIGPVTPEPRKRLLAKGLCLLHMTTIPERFGLIMPEAFACGTPVIAIDLGSCREIVDKKSGFLVNNVDEAIEAVKDIKKIKRADCRKRVEEKFTVDHMAQNYIKVYDKIFKTI